MRRYLAVVAALFGLLFGGPANADTTWDFTPSCTPDCFVNLGASQNFTSGGVTINAAGFTSPTALTGAPNALLDQKNFTSSALEQGLGLQADPTGEGEIFGNGSALVGSLVRISMAGARTAGLVDFSFQMNSATAGEGWLVFGGNNADGTGSTEVAHGTDDILHLLTGAAGAFAFYFVAFDPTTFIAGEANNVLLKEVDAIATPLPSALLLFGTGLLGLLTVRRRIT